MKNYNFENRLIFSLNESSLDKESFTTAINELIEKSEILGVVYGEFDVPRPYDICSQNISHSFMKMRFENGNVYADVKILATDKGKQIRSLMVALDDQNLELFRFKPRAFGNDSGIIDEITTFDICSK
mgnify:CR=1 FL=1